MSSVSRSEIKFSLMSFNIAHGRGLSLYQGFHSSNGIRKNLERIAAIIKKRSPDIVAFQEVDQSSHWNRHIDLLKHIQEETEYPYSEHGIHNTRLGRKALCYGNAFLSKHPISNCRVTPFGKKSIGEKGFDSNRFNTTRDYQSPSRFQVPTKPNGSDRSHSRKNRDFNKVKHTVPPNNLR